MDGSPGSTNLSETQKADLPDPNPVFRPGQRVHYAGDSGRIGTVKYVGPVQGYSGQWVGVDWDNADGKHDGSVNGVRYFQAASEKSASLVRPQNLSGGISVVDGLNIRYRGESTKEEENEMYVLSATNKRVSIQLLGKDKIQDKLSHLDKLTSASLAFLGVSSPGLPGELGSVAPNLKALDLTGNLLSEWKDIGAVCHELKELATLNLSCNVMSQDVTGLPVLCNIRVLVLSFTGIKWAQIELLKHFSPVIEELHLAGNRISEITVPIALTMLTDNPISDPAKGGIPRFVLIARLEKVKVLNGSEITPRERKESEIRYIRLAMSKLHDNLEEINRQHPRLFELRKLHGLEDERPSNGPTAVTLKCVGASMGEKPPLTKKLPATISIGKLKILCESFFKLKSVNLKLFLQEQGSPFPTLLDDETSSLLDVGVSQESTILVDEENTYGNHQGDTFLTAKVTTYRDKKGT
ncbi:hypothetical protein V2J09_017398 [Rumex salicifolius]